MRKKVFVTAGAACIGSLVVRQLVAETDWKIVNIDKLTYAGNLASIPGLLDYPRHVFAQVDICDARSTDESVWSVRGLRHLKNCVSKKP